MNGTDLKIESSLIADEQSDQPATPESAKKEFIAPEVSVPVDVLEATTFFQVSTSGSTT